MHASFLPKSFVVIAALAGALAMAGCAANQPNSSGNPTGMGATPSGSADQKVDSGLHSPDNTNGSTTAGGSYGK
jgi:hypothetical protein